MLSFGSIFIFFGCSQCFPFVSGSTSGVTMTHKTAYIWGPISSFSGQLAAFLAQKGWHVHVATKGAFHVALSPLDLRSTAQASLEKAFADREKFKIFEDRVRFVDVNEVSKSTKYDAFIFCGLPPNFDEPRVSRAPWAAEEFPQIAKKFKGVPVFIVSSLWGAIQKDGVVPEEMECERRKPLTQYEAVAQQYENRLLKNLGSDESQWHLVRLPMISGSSADGHMLNFSGPLALFQRLDEVAHSQGKKKKPLELCYDPDEMLWFLPVDLAVHIFWRLLEDEQRPPICNLVSTQATLNQEWLQHLAKALNASKAVNVEADSHNLPTALRKALHDNIQVKTRGLFELMGRYQQVPTVIDQQYFEKVINFGRSARWGQLHPQEPTKNGKHELAFSEDLAREYFMEFVPNNFASATIQSISGDGTGIGFKVEDAPNLDWILKSENGESVVIAATEQDRKPSVRFIFSGAGMLKLIQRKMGLERALVTRDARVEGKPMEILKAINVFKTFLRNHPYSTVPVADTDARPLATNNK